jgi:hypothetical protein
MFVAPRIHVSEHKAWSFLGETRHTQPNLAWTSTTQSHDGRKNAVVAITRAPRNVYRCFGCVRLFPCLFLAHLLQDLSLSPVSPYMRVLRDDSLQRKGEDLVSS